MEILDVIKKVNSGEILTNGEMTLLMEEMLQGNLTEGQIGAALIAMKVRGERVDEVATAVEVLDKHKIKFEHNMDNVVDTCGTGGDGKSTINISTAVSIILSAMNTKVVKHGNVAQSGKVGSANILEEYDIPLDLPQDKKMEYFEDNGFIFLFAPKFHPALKYVGKVRKELKVPTLFNYLGPLLNPADPDYQVIGFSKLEKLEFYAQVIAKLGRKNIAVYSSLDGYDEISSNAPTEIYLINVEHTEGLETTDLGDGVKKAIVNPNEYFETFEMPKVESTSDAKEKFHDAISGKNENYAKLLALNSALIFTIMGKGSFEENFVKVFDTIKSGKVVEKLNQLKA
jgi:anthranilate phosphoribosyltransferase